MAVAASLVGPVIDSAIMHEKRSSTGDRIATDQHSTNFSDIRIVAPHEYKRAAACLADAFRDDHTVRYPIDTPDRTHWTESQRFTLHLQAMEFVTYAHCLRGLVTTVGPDFDCVALWMPPGKNIDDWWTIVRSGMWRLNWLLSSEGRERFFGEFLPLLARTKREVLGEREGASWYLNYIGTRSGSRGMGYAKRLIGHISAVVSFADLSLCVYSICALGSFNLFSLFVFSDMRNLCSCVCVCVCVCEANVVIDRYL